MAKKVSPVPVEKLALYQELVATIPRLQAKGAAMPYTSLNGHMFSFLTKMGTLALRLPATERQAFLEKYETSLTVQHGTVMKEYVDVPAVLLEKIVESTPYFAISYEYIASLKPKPTKRKKATA
jgi:hypothetical protein